MHNDSFVVNIYDEKNRPAKEGNIVVTPLYKTDLPLINYAIGDKEPVKFVMVSAILQAYRDV